jgi:hypothetical protein
MSIFLYCCIQHYVPKPLKMTTFLTLATYEISNYKFQKWMYVNLKFFSKKILRWQIWCVLFHLYWMTCTWMMWWNIWFWCCGKICYVVKEYFFTVVNLVKFFSWCGCNILQNILTWYTFLYIAQQLKWKMFLLHIICEKWFNFLNNIFGIYMNLCIYCYYIDV